jgi:hypothetical protein
MTDDPHGPDDVPRAARISIRVCSHGHVFVHLIDEHDRVVAVAPFCAQGAKDAGAGLFRAGESALRGQREAASPMPAVH